MTTAPTGVPFGEAAARALVVGCGDAARVVADRIDGVKGGGAACETPGTISITASRRLIAPVILDDRRSNDDLYNVPPLALNCGRHLLDRVHLGRRYTIVTDGYEVVV